MDKSAPICFCIRTTQFTSFRNLCQPWNHTFFVWNWHHAYGTNNVHLFYRVNTRNPPSYEEKAGFFSKILFMWLNPLLTLGNKRTLNPEDLPQLSYSWFWPLPLVPVTRQSEFTRQFRRNGRRRRKRGWFWSFWIPRSPSLVKSMFRSFGLPFMLAAILKLVHDICQFMGPVMLNRVINFLKSTDQPIVFLSEIIHG